MEPQALLGVVVLIIIVIYFLKTLKDIFQGLMLIGLALVASGLIIGGTPELGGLPFVGSFLGTESVAKGIPGTIIDKAEGLAWDLKIIGAQKDSAGNLLVIVQNTGQLGLDKFSMKANNRTIVILSGPEKLGKGETAALISGYKPAGAVKIELEAGQAKAELVKEF